MNYARAIKSGQVTEKIVNSIQSQSLIELGKELTGEEKRRLFSHIQPSALLEQIDKVRIKLQSLLLSYIDFSMAMVHSDLLSCWLTNDL